MNCPRAFVPLYLLTLLLVGIGYLAILPPFEGFDEAAHYSSIRQLAATGIIPTHSASFIDVEAIGYKGPQPYATRTPPFDDGLVYSKFFAQPELEEAFRTAYRQPRASVFQPSVHVNWEAQHPPLYYLLLAPLAKVTEGFSFVGRMFWLRLASYVLALGGVALGLLAMRSAADSAESDATMLGYALYPVVLPMFFPEFTRIGNDSLCLLIVGATAALYAAWRRRPDNAKLAVATGIVLGLGLLTKAFFLPILAALAVDTGLRAWRAETSPLRAPMLLVAPALAIGGGWYVYQVWTNGSLIGGADALYLAGLGDAFGHLRRNFSLAIFTQALVVTFVTYVWAGTWSLVRLPTVLFLPLLALVAWAFATFAWWLRSQPLKHPQWLCALLFAAFVVGLVDHALIAIAAYGNGNTPGWYFHILAPWTAPALGLGLATIMRSKARVLLIVLLGYAVVFQLMALWSQAALFAGCAVKDEHKHYAFSGSVFCLDQIAAMRDRLSVIAWPDLAVAAFAGGIVCGFMLLALGVRARRTGSPTPCR